MRAELEYLRTFRGRYHSLLNATRAEVERLGGSSYANRGQVYLGLFMQDIEFDTVADLLTEEEFAFWVGARDYLAKLKRQNDINLQSAYLNIAGTVLPVLSLASLLLRTFSEDLGGLAHSQAVSDKLWTDWTIYVVKEIISTIPIVGGVISGAGTVAVAAVQVTATVILLTTQQLLNVYVNGEEFDSLGYTLGVVGSVASLGSAAGPAAGHAIQTVNTLVQLATPLLVKVAEGQQNFEDEAINAVAGAAGALGSAAGIPGAGNVSNVLRVTAVLTKTAFEARGA